HPRRTGRPAPRWAGRLAALGLAAAGLVGATLPAAAPASAGLLGTQPYIVSDSNGVGSALAASVVTSVGGQVLQPLDISNAVLANLTSLEVTLLQAVPGVTVTPDVTVYVQSSGSSSHPGSDAFLQESQATNTWTTGDTGAGVNVAVLDTGIDPLPDFAGRLVGGVDLSGGGNPFNDQYGHGTFVAGLVAGNGASSNGKYMGEAPGAGLVAVKVAGSTGTTDLATIIAGVGWTVANEAALHIGVLNMSLGYQPIASTAVDPLDFAVEQAWRAGIVVVTSAGNAGPFNGTIVSPGDDPLVITTGALDDMGTPSTADDQMAPFSSVGPTSPDGWFKPDLVASGRSVISLRAAGSTVDTTYPSARVGTGNFVGSGTSFSAAIMSGAAALLLAAHPGYLPNDVKSALLQSTTPGPVGNPFVDGHGALDVAAAVSATPVALSQPVAGVPVAMGTTVLLQNTWAESAWNPGNWQSVAWNSVAWNGSSWSGVSGNSVAWNGSVWNSVAWNGNAWNSVAWNGAGWNSVAWNGSSWNSVAWNGSSWNGAAWNSVAWNGSSWN
ncbi:MAG TPA: S8 family serine peptidase, partial [Acidimicrobiales bacterium]|nr:S8 family serine peptidase [Acidimicrobiales bacterium]